MELISNPIHDDALPFEKVLEVLRSFKVGTNREFPTGFLSPVTVTFSIRSDGNERERKRHRLEYVVKCENALPLLVKLLAESET